MKIEEVIKTSKMPNTQRTVINLIYTANKASDRLSDVLKPFDISLQQFNVLRILRGQKGVPANLSTIQERMIHKMSNTTRLVDKLIAKQLVKRNTCRENRRKVEIFITQSGLDILDKLDNLIAQAERDLTRELKADEFDALNLLLEKVRS